MASITTADISANLIRAELWSNTLKETLKEELMGQRWIDTLVDFPDGETFVIPSIGDTVAQDYVEGEAVQYLPRDTGRWEFSITEYIQSGTSITKKAMQDSFYADRLTSRFVPDQLRAIMEHFEVKAFAASETGLAANDARTINGYAHRVAGGNAGALQVQDFAYAKLALQKANVPMTGLVAIVPPEFEYTINTLSNLVSVADNPMWDGIISTSMNPTGMRFVKNIYGFDVYTSNYLPDVKDSALKTAAGAAINLSAKAAKASYFFSAGAGADLLPWKAAWRQAPQVDYKFEQDYQEHRWVTTARYGVKEYRPENLVTIAASTQVL